MWILKGEMTHSFFCKWKLISTKAHLCPVHTQILQIQPSLGGITVYCSTGAFWLDVSQSRDLNPHYNRAWRCVFNWICISSQYYYLRIAVVNTFHFLKILWSESPAVTNTTLQLKVKMIKQSRSETKTSNHRDWVKRLSIATHPCFGFVVMRPRCSSFGGKAYTLWSHGTGLQSLMDAWPTEVTPSQTLPAPDWTNSIGWLSGPRF